MLYTLTIIQHLEQRRGLTDYVAHTDCPARLFQMQTAITLIERYLRNM